MPKSAVGPINSSKNKLNNKISWLFNLEPNACYESAYFTEIENFLLKVS